MGAKCHLTINGRAIRADVGETLVDAALGGRVLLPHDCCSGQCETCRVKVLSGDIDDQGTAEGDTVLACLATLEGDAAIEFEEVPTTAKVTGTVAEIRRLSPEVVEVVVALKSPLTYLPGQYVSAAFAGFPSRDYSPTLRLDGFGHPGELVFHIRLLPDGIVSSAIGRAITIGHKVQVRGPFGRAFFRRGEGPLVLVAGGTGWAPIWAVAHAAVVAQPGREIVVLAGARSVADLYMLPSFEWLWEHGVRELIVTSEADQTPGIRPGRPTNYLPLLGPRDTVYVAGAPGLVDAVKRKARAAGAECFADAFTPSAQRVSLVDRVARLLRTPGGRDMAADPLSPRPQRLADIDGSGAEARGDRAPTPPRRSLQTALFGARSAGRRS